MYHIQPWKYDLNTLKYILKYSVIRGWQILYSKYFSFQRSQLFWKDDKEFVMSLILRNPSDLSGMKGFLSVQVKRISMSLFSCRCQKLNGTFIRTFPAHSDSVSPVAFSSVTFRPLITSMSQTDMLRLLSCSLKNLTLLSPSFIHATDLHCGSKDLGIIGIKHSALIAETPYIKCPDRSFKGMSVEHCRIISQRNNDKTKENRKHINEWSYICIQATYDSEMMICVTARGIGKVIKSPKITWNCLVDMHHRTHA